MTTGRLCAGLNFVGVIVRAVARVQTSRHEIISYIAVSPANEAARSVIDDDLKLVPDQVFGLRTPAARLPGRCRWDHLMPAIPRHRRENMIVHCAVVPSNKVIKKPRAEPVMPPSGTEAPLVCSHAAVMHSLSTGRMKRIEIGS